MYSAHSGKHTSLSLVEKMQEILGTMRRKIKVGAYKEQSGPSG